VSRGEGDLVRKVATFLAAVAVIGTMLAVWGGTGSARVNLKGSPLTGRSDGPKISTAKAKLQKSWSSYGNDVVTVESGFQPIDGVQSFTCPGTTTCSFTAEQNVQVTGTAANNRWAICTQIDGNFMDKPVCPILGVVPTTILEAGSFAQSQTGLTPGAHTVQTFLWTDFGATRIFYEIIYRYYRP
jgi:hypothetical protein